MSKFMCIAALAIALVTAAGGRRSARVKMQPSHDEWAHSNEPFGSDPNKAVLAYITDLSCTFDATSAQTGLRQAASGCRAAMHLKRADSTNNGLGATMCPAGLSNTAALSMQA